MTKLYRSKEDRIFAGVAGGVGEYFNTDSTIIRLIFLLLTFITGILPLVLFYIVAALIVPTRKSEAKNEQGEEKDLVENKRWIRFLATLIVVILLLVFVLVSIFVFGSIFSILNWGSLGLWEWWLGPALN